MPLDKLARVRWYVGQTLLPEHLVAQEDAASAEQRAYARLGGLPGWGVARLSWNDAQLSGGVLALTELTVILQGGELLDVPGNARVAPLDLNARKRASAAVWLNVRGGNVDAEGVPRYADDPPHVARVMRRIELSADAPLDGAIASLKLAEVDKDATRGWQLSTGYVPPLLQVGVDNPFQIPLVGKVQSILIVLESQLLLRLSNETQPALTQSNTRHFLAHVQRTLAQLDDLEHGISPHPFVLFRALRELYFALCVFVEVAADANLPSYRHDDPAGSFAALTALVQERLAPATTRVTEQRFLASEGLYLLSPLPEAARRAAEVYLLVRSAEAIEPAAIQTLKLAGRARLRTIHKLILAGIPIRHVPEPPFPHSFARDVSFFLLGKGPEWELAAREGNLAFHAHPALEGCHVSLFWR